jgi:hypothetical protein
MKKRWKTLCLVSVAAAFAVAVFIVFWSTSEDSKLDATAAAAERAVADLYAQYRASYSEDKLPYKCFVVHGQFDAKAVLSRMHGLDVPVLSFGEVRPYDWRKERGTEGFGPQYIYLRKDTGQEAFIVNIELVQCSRFFATAKIAHDVGGVTYCLRRWPGQSWQVIRKRDEYQTVY